MIRKTSIFLPLFVVVTAIIPVFAQGAAPGNGRMYNASTETTITGTVAEVQQTTGRRGWAGTHLLLNTEAGKVEVHVGPSTYLAEHQFSFAQGNQVEVVGSRVNLQGSDALIARQIKKDGKTLPLRDEHGLPLWSRGRDGVN